MKHRDAVKIITAWEFRRFLRLGELISTVLITVALGAGIPLAMDFFASRSEGATVTLAQTGGAPLQAVGGFEFVPMDSDAAAEALAEDDIDGIIDVSDPEAPVLLLPSEEPWTEELSEHLVSAALDERLDAAGIDPQELEAVLSPVRLDVRLTTSDSGRGADTLVIVVVSGTMLFVIFLGTGMLFGTITGEKTNRVTEQIVSAVSPQAWIDGKVLGTGGYMLVYLLALGLGIVLAVVVRALIAGEPVPPLPPAAASPLMIIVAVLFGLLGTAFYYMLFAAVAATIDDPNTSQRSGLIMLPALFVGLSFLGLLGSTDSVLFRIMSYLPLTSPSAMPIRLLAGDAGTFEVIVSLLVMIICVLLARFAAGRIFSLGILMTGKEPTWREMLHWLRRA